MRDNLIIGISGKKGSGKDTFYKIVREINSDFVNLKFADKLKSICAEITGLPINYFYDRDYYGIYLDRWGMTIREFMQKLGTEALRENFDPEIWVKSLMVEIEDRNQPAIITDVRFKNEANAIKDAGGYLVRINPGFSSYENTNDQHRSEIELDDYEDWDFLINNNKDLDSYVKSVILVFNQILGKS